MFVYLLCVKLRESRKEGHMCSTCCALGVVGIYCVQQFVFVTFVANRPFGRLGVEGRIILRRVLNRNGLEQFGVTKDGISDTPQNDNRLQNSPDNREL